MTLLHHAPRRTLAPPGKRGSPEASTAASHGHLLLEEVGQGLEQVEQRARFPLRHERPPPRDDAPAPPHTAAALAAAFAAILHHHAAVSCTLRMVKTSTPGIGFQVTTQLATQLASHHARTKASSTCPTRAHTYTAYMASTTAAAATGSRKRGAPCGNADADEAVTVPMKAMKGAVHIHVRGQSVFRGPSCDVQVERYSADAADATGTTAAAAAADAAATAPENSPAARSLASAATDTTHNGFIIQGVNAAAAAAAATAAAADAAVLRDSGDLGPELKAVGLNGLSSADTTISVLPQTPDSNDYALFDYADANVPDVPDETEGLQGITCSLLSLFSASGFQCSPIRARRPMTLIEMSYYEYPRTLAATLRSRPEL